MFTLMIGNCFKLDYSPFVFKLFFSELTVFHSNKFLFNNFTTFSNLAVRFKRSLGMPGPEKIFIDKIN